MTTGRTVARAVRRLALVACLVALLIGLGDRPAPRPEPPPRLDVIVAVDRTASMSAVDDPDGSRMTAVRRDLLELVDHLSGAQVGLITFGRDATVALPLTADRAAVEDAVQNLQTELPTAGAGSALDRPVPLILDQLQQAARGGADRSRQVSEVVLVSDGEATAPSRLSAYAPVDERTRTALVLGYGTTKGGVMPLTRLNVDGGNAAQVAAGPLVPDRSNGAPAVSRLNPDNLRRIARQMGGQYVAADGSQDMPKLAAELEAAAYAGLPPSRPQRQLRWLWGLLLLTLTVPELLLGWRSYLEAQREAQR